MAPRVSPAAQTLPRSKLRSKLGLTPASELLICRLLSKDPAAAVPNPLQSLSRPETVEGKYSTSACHLSGLSAWGVAADAYRRSLFEMYPTVDPYQGPRAYPGEKRESQVGRGPPTS